MDIADWLGIKSREQEEREFQAFSENSFPYGQPQRDKVEELLSQLFPKEKKQFTMMLFLLGKQYYHGYGLRNEQDYQGYTQEERLNIAAKSLNRQLTGKHRKSLTTYLALIAADAQVDENLLYPTAQEIQEQARAL
jgi:hypothetical protein